MTTRDITTICGVVMRLAGIPLIIWGTSKEAFYIGVTLLMSGEVGSIGRALITHKAATTEDIERLQRSKPQANPRKNPRKNP